MGRFGQPEEIAAVVELLVTNSYMTNKVCTKCSDTRPSESLRSNSLAFCNKTRIRIEDRVSGRRDVAIYTRLRSAAYDVWCGERYVTHTSTGFVFTLLFHHQFRLSPWESWDATCYSGSSQTSTFSTVLHEQHG